MKTLKQYLSVLALFALATCEPVAAQKFAKEDASNITPAVWITKMDLGDLAMLDAITSAQITNGTITTDDLAFSANVEALLNAANYTAFKTLLDYGDLASLDTVGSAQITDESIGNSDLAANSVGQTNITADAIQSGQIQDGEVHAADIGSNEVNGSHIEDSTVTTDDILDGTILGDDIGNDTIQTGNIGADAIISAHILDGTIQGGDIAEDAIGAMNLADDSVLTQNIFDGTITLDDLAPNLVGDALGEGFSVTDTFDTLYFSADTTDVSGIGVADPATSGYTDMIACYEAGTGSYILGGGSMIITDDDIIMETRDLWLKFNYHLKLDTSSIIKWDNTDAIGYDGLNVYFMLPVVFQQLVEFSAGANLSGAAGYDFSGTPVTFDSSSTVTSDAPVTLNSLFTLTPIDVASLPVAPPSGTFAVVNDAVSAGFQGGIVAGGGAVTTLVMFDGTNWTLH